ncbi:hypothetical protein RJ640_017204 [Escallonia rubra]|uniref:GAG-pre-integrase domain-containing protein n=1 Tax=Escallonia rubra TaxID=112253 RepID=A0AA88QM88_9ASTE|nr:hypothetical protein RJ640_017204 [Escallonia rubra]
MFRRNPTNQSHQRNNGDWTVRENSDACYECGRTGHIKKYWPQLKNKTANSNSNSRDLKEKKFKSRKALLTWDNSDKSDKEESEDEDVAQLCFMANDDDLKHNDIWLWHRRLGHVHMDLIKKLLSKDLVRGLPNLREFEMSMMGELTFFLGLQIKQSKDGIFINQSKYTRELLKRFGLENAKPRGTPISPSVNLIKDENGKDVDSKLFRGMIGSLLYLTASRPDIMFSVCICARFQACPKESHLSAVKRIFKYLSGTLNLGLWYPRNSSIDLVGFSDSDYAGCLVDRKSTSGTCQFLGDALVSWHSKKQTSVALSTAEAEYVAAGSCCAQVLWMRQTLQDFGVSLALIPIMCDSSSAIDIRRVSDIVLRFELAPEASWYSERLETGHIKKYCPQLKNKTANSNSRDFKEKKFKSRKALLTWDDSDESDKEGSEDEDVAQLCFMANDDDLKHNDIWLWHRRLGHVHMDLIKKLLSKDLVRGLPNLRFIKDKICDACQYVRNRHLWLYPPLKRNMLQLEAVVPKFYGCVKPYKILVSL